jgi:hypothetical protein
MIVESSINNYKIDLFLLNLKKKIKTLIIHEHYYVFKKKKLCSN